MTTRFAWHRRWRSGFAVTFVVVCALTLAWAARVHSRVERENSILRSSTQTRVVSVALASDVMLLRLLDPVQLVGVSWIVDWPEYWEDSPVSRSIARTTGAVEPLLALRPDLVVVADFSTPGLGAQLRSLGVPIFELSTAPTLDAMVSDVERLGARVHRTGEARRWSNELRQRIAQVSAHARSRPKYRALVLNAGMTEGKGTLLDDVLASLGTRNVASDAGLSGLVTIDAEQLLAWAPDVVFVSVSNNSNIIEARDELSHLGGFASLHALITRVPCRVVGVSRAQLSAISPAIVDALEAMDRALERGLS